MTESTSGDFFERMAIVGLLRTARRAYRDAIRDALADGGFDDVPRNGAYVLGRVHDDNSALGDLARGLGISKQAVSQLIDTMVMRGYVERTPAADDRRRMILTLTPRGTAAATVSWQAAVRTDEELQRRLTADGVAALRSGLIALCEMSLELGAHGAESE
jgi:DNA-binding MarR family transcriptional regulator